MNNENTKEQLDAYIEQNCEYISKLYEKYLEIVKELEIAEGWVWGQEQFAAAMMMAEFRHAHLMEKLEFELDKNGFDPFQNMKMATYIIGKSEKGSVAMIYFRTKEQSIFALKVFPANIMDMAQQQGFSIGCSGNKLDNSDFEKKE